MATKSVWRQPGGYLGLLFFDGEHVIMKGASMATAKELLRPTFRNWFRVRYPYVYATFRCAT